MKSNKVYLAVFIPIIAVLVIIIAFLLITVVLLYNFPNVIRTPDYFEYNNEKYYMMDTSEYDEENQSESELVAAVSIINDESDGVEVAYLSTAEIDGEIVKIMFVPSMSADYINNIEYAVDHVK